MSSRGSRASTTRTGSACGRWQNGEGKMASKRQYAENTTVTVDRSQSEARRLLQRYGADTIRFTEDAERTVIEFRLSGWVIRFLVSAPALTEEVVTYTRSGQWRPEGQRASAQKQEYQ